MTPQQRGRRTVARLLDAALAVHAEHGPGGLTVQALTGACGISAGSLYHHFGSVDGVTSALYARCMGELLDALVAATTAAATARDGVQALVRAYLRFAVEKPAVAGVVHSFAWTSFAPAHRAAVEAVKAPRMAALLGWLRPHTAAGDVVDLPDPLVEMLLVGPAAETVRRHLAGDEGVDLDEAIRLLPERVWRSVQVSDSSLS